MHCKLSKQAASDGMQSRAHPKMHTCTIRVQCPARPGAQRCFILRKHQCVRSRDSCLTACACAELPLHTTVPVSFWHMSYFEVRGCGAFSSLAAHTVCALFITNDCAKGTLRSRPASSGLTEQGHSELSYETEQVACVALRYEQDPPA